MLYQLVADTHKRLRAFDLCRFHLVPRNVGICPASSGLMKPKPFLSSKNFIQPVGIADVPHVATCARGTRGQTRPAGALKQLDLEGRPGRLAQEQSRRARPEGLTRHELVMKLVPKHKNQRSVLQKAGRSRSDRVHCLWSQARVGLRSVQIKKELEAWAFKLLWMEAATRATSSTLLTSSPVAKAEERFQALIGKGFRAVALERDGNSGELTGSFDPNVEETLFIPQLNWPVSIRGVSKIKGLVVFRPCLKLKASGNDFRQHPASFADGRSYRW